MDFGTRGTNTVTLSPRTRLTSGLFRCLETESHSRFCNPVMRKMPRPFPNDRRIAYSSTESGHSEVYVASPISRCLSPSSK